MIIPVFPKLKAGTWTPARRALWVDQSCQNIRGQSEWEKHPEEGPALRQRLRVLLDWAEAKTPDAIEKVWEDARTHKVTVTTLADKALFLERFDLLDFVRQSVGEKWDTWEVSRTESFAGLCQIPLDTEAFEKNRNWQVTSMLSEARTFGQTLEKAPRWVDRMCEVESLVDALIAQNQWDWKAPSGPNARRLRFVRDDIVVRFHQAATSEDQVFIDHQLEEYTARLASKLGTNPWMHEDSDASEKIRHLSAIVDHLFSLGANPDVLLTRRVRADQKDKESPLVEREVTSAFHLAVLCLALREARSTGGDNRQKPGESKPTLALKPEVVERWLEKSHPENTAPSTELFYRILELVTPMGAGNAGRSLIERFSALPDAPGVPSRIGQFLQAASVFGTDWVMTSAGCDHVPPLRPVLADFIHEAHRAWPEQLRALRDHAKNPWKRKEAEAEERINRVPGRERASRPRWYDHDGLLIGGAPLDLMGHFLEDEAEKKTWNVVLPMAQKACHDVGVVEDEEVEETIDAFLGQFALHVVLVDTPGRPVQGPLRRL